ncbi:MAG: hypothetical protein HY313_09020 [Acidobacteria bacterium]|nr:hypothetical protein [Acidobacteriota bacterium]
MQTREWLKVVIALLMLWGGPQAWSQEAATPQTSTQPQQAQPPAARSAGRRDPFRAIVVKRVEEIPARLPPGKAGLVIGQIQVQGIVHGIDGEWIAMVDTNTNRAYFLREKDEVWNGTVSRITEDSVVFQERVRDASGRTQTREVVKRLEERTGRRPTGGR